MAILEALTSAFWTEAPAEQRRLTVQLARNSAYFAAAIYVIRHYGDRLAI
jgi:hypothetical protein